jgi:hypothetical protein
MTLKHKINNSISYRKKIEINLLNVIQESVLKLSEPIAIHIHSKLLHTVSKFSLHKEILEDRRINSYDFKRKN